MSMFKRAKIVLLSTKEVTNFKLVKNPFKKIDNLRLLCFSHYGFDKIEGEFQHLYILSDEEIMIGDWYYTSLEHDNSFIRQCKVIDKSKEYWLDNDLKYQGNLKSDYGSYKIIATTDSSMGIFDENNHQLYYYPSPSRSFIQKYVDEYNKGNIITDILVEYNTSDENMDGYVSMFGGKEIGDTLKINAKENTISIKRIKVSYNRDEVIFLLNGAFGLKTLADLDDWIKENL